MSKFRVGLVGAGVMGSLHAKKLYEIQQSKHFDIDFSGIFDIDNSRAKATAHENHARAFSSLEEMLSNGIDAVIIATPTRFHHETADYFLNRGVHALIEKPITDDWESAKRIYEKYNDKDVKIMVGHIERFNPAVSELKKIISKDSDKIHTLMVQRAGSFPSRIRDVGTVFDMAIHDIDVSNYLFGSYPSSVFCRSVNLGKSENYEDSAHIILSYPNNRIASITSNWSTSRKIRNLTALAENYAFKLDYSSQELEILKGISATATPTKWEDFQIGSLGIETRLKFLGEPLYIEVEHFLDCAINNKQVLVTAKEGANNLRIAQYALQSSKKHKELFIKGLIY